jgi:mercuric ion transport protein
MSNIDVAPRSRRRVGSGTGWLTLGGVAAAIGASSCCVLPFTFFVLGVSGAWIGNLTALAPIFLALAAVFIGLGFWRVYRRSPAAECADGEFCARPDTRRLTRTALWAATALVVLAFVFPYIAPLFLKP